MSKEEAAEKARKAAENKVRASITGFKSHHTRRCKSIYSLLSIDDGNETVGASDMIVALREELRKLNELHENIVHQYDTLRKFIIEEDEMKDLERRQDDLENRHQETRNAALRFITLSSRATTAPMQEMGDQRQRPRPIDSLKPVPLTTDFTPGEFTNWKYKFRDFYESSYLAALEPRAQQSYLFSCLDKKLESVLRDKVDANTPIYGENGCMDLLKTEFNEAYPLFTRRLKFFRMSPAAGQDFSDFVRELHRAGGECDLQDMSVDDTYRFRYLTAAAQDSRLVEKFIEAGDCTTARYRTIITQHEQAKKTVEAAKLNQSSTNDSASAAAATDDRRDISRGGRPGNNGWQSATRGKCFACGVPGHQRSSCTVPREQLQCNKCKKKGHVASVCMGGRQQQQQRGRSPTPSPRANQAETDTEQVSAIEAVNAASSRPTPTFYCEMNTDHKNAHRRKSFACEVTPDTGATMTIIAKRVIDRHQVTTRPAHQKLRAANGRPMPVHGTVVMEVTAMGRSATVEALVVEELSSDCLMSWHDLVALGVIPRTFPYQERCNTVAVDECDQLKRKMLKEFEDVFCDSLEGRVLDGQPMHIHLVDDKPIVPRRILTARQVPLHMQKGADELITKLVKEGIIAPVEEPTDWISPGHFVPKPNGGVRLVTDFTQLNKFVKRPVHPFPSTKDIIQSLDPTARVFAKMDAIQGYFQIPLDEESSKLTTFLVHSGRYRYTRAPMGLNASGDEWCRRSDEPFSGHPGTSKLVDDGLTQAASLEELETRLRALLQDCRKHGVTLSKAKFDIGPSVKFAGHVIGASGVYPDPEKLAAIREFPTPKDVTDVRSFLGLANQLASFLPDLAQVSEPLRQLLKKGNAFMWMSEHDEAMAAVKKILTSDAVVKPFQMGLPTELLTDASRLNGLGFVLLQRENDGGQRVIRCGSRSLQPAETRYATIELECLAILYAVKQCSHYLQGARFHVVTDHRPLVGVFNKDLYTITNPRLHRIREKLLGYDFSISWVAGKRHLIADALSRAPVFAAPEEDNELALSLSPSLGLLAESIDGEYRALAEAVVRQDDPQKLPPSHPARPYANMWGQLGVEGGGDKQLVVLDGHRVVVPILAREAILQKLHAGHCGVNKTRQLANQLYYWPGMSNAIQQMVGACEHCNKLLPSQTKMSVSELCKETNKNSFPMSDVGIDLFAFAGSTYIIMVDRYSGFPFCKVLRSTTTTAVLNVLVGWFHEWGFPTAMRTDGGPQFRSEFKEFCTKHGIKHELASPHHHESNGLAESAVKNVKYLLTKCRAAKQDFYAALLEWRNTPRADGSVPSALFLGRRQRTSLPVHPDVLRPMASADIEVMAQDKALTREKSEKMNDAHSKNLTSLQIGDKVLLQDAISGKWDRQAEVTGVLDAGRSYTILTLDGSTYTRNRTFLRPCTITHASQVQVKRVRFSVPLELPRFISAPPPPPLDSSTSWATIAAGAPHPTPTLTTVESTTRLLPRRQEGSTSLRCISQRSISGLPGSSSSSSSRQRATQSSGTTSDPRAGSSTMRAEGNPIKRMGTISTTPDGPNATWPLAALPSCPCPQCKLHVSMRSGCQHQSLSGCTTSQPRQPSSVPCQTQTPSTRPRDLRPCLKPCKGPESYVRRSREVVQG